MKAGLGWGTVLCGSLMLANAAFDRPWRTALAGLAFGFLWALWAAHP